MRRNQYSHIFFDLDNTLWDFEKNSFSALHAAFLHFSIDEQGIRYEDFFAVYSKYNRELWEEYRRQKIMKNELKKLRFQKAFDELKIEKINPIEMNSVYLAEMPKQKKLVEGAEDVLSYLKSKGYLLYIITNGFCEVQYKKLEATNLSTYFTKIFISEEVKAPKPDLKIFEYAIKSANAPKQKSLMVGDDFEIDIKGALNYGIDAVFFITNNSNDHQNCDLIKQDKRNCYFIDELRNLKDII